MRLAAAAPNTAGHVVAAAADVDKTGMCTLVHKTGNATAFVFVDEAPSRFATAWTQVVAFVHVHVNLPASDGRHPLAVRAVVPPELYRASALTLRAATTRETYVLAVDRWCMQNPPHGRDGIVYGLLAHADVARTYPLPQLQLPRADADTQ